MRQAGRCALLARSQSHEADPPFPACGRRRRREAAFHNGQPVTSDDVRCSTEQVAGETSTASVRAEMQRTFAPGRRRAIYAELEELALQEVPTAGLAWRDQGYAMARDLHGSANAPGAPTFCSARTLGMAEFA